MATDHDGTHGSSLKLFGRDAQIQILREAFEKCCHVSESSSEPSSSRQQQVVFIRGGSGSGKTALANTLQPMVNDQGGFFLSGKFELGQNQAPFYAFVEAFTRLAHHLQTKGQNGPSTKTTLSSSQPSSQSHKQQNMLALVRDAILDKIGKEGKLLTDIIPSLRNIIAHQNCDDDDDGNKDGDDNVMVSSGKQASQRLQLLFQKLCEGLASVAPLILFLDDLQWSDTASLELLDALLQPSSSFPMMVIGTFRDDEVALWEGHTKSRPSELQLQSSQCGIPSPFSHFVREKKLLDSSTLSTGTSTTTNSNDHDNVTVICLDHLDQSSLNELVAGVLEIPTTSSPTELISKRLLSQSDGSVFHALQLLQLWLDQRVVYRDTATHQVLFQPEEQDMEQRALLGAVTTANVLVRNQIQALSSFTQEVLRVAACLGDEIDESVLSTLLDGRMSDITLSLKEALDKDLLSRSIQAGRYSFRHDRIRQATLSTIANADALSFELGYKLWKQSSPHYACNQIFALCNLLAIGVDSITDQSEKYELAAYFMEAAEKAMSIAAFANAFGYVEQGVALLKGGGNYWQDHYDLSLGLFNLAIDAALCNQRFDTVTALANETLANARTVRDKITAYTAMINANGQNRRMEEAIQIGIDTLKQLGITMPLSPSKYVIVKEIIMTKKAIGGRSNYEILSLAPMQDEMKLAAMHVLHNLLPYAYQRAPPLVVLIGTKLVQLTMKYGLSKLSSMGFVTFAWILCKSARQEGYRLGEVALSIVRTTRARELLPKVQSSFYFFTSHWSRPLSESLVPLQDAYSVGMNNGDLESALYSFSFECSFSLFCGMRLELVEEKYLVLVNQLRLYKQKNALGLVLPYFQYLHNMMGLSPDPIVLLGPIFGSDAIDTENMIQLVVRCGLGADLAFFFEDFDLAQELVTKRKATNTKNFASYSYAAYMLTDGLVAAAQIRMENGRQRNNVRLLRQCCSQMASWARDCPQNFRHKQKLLEAELRSTKCHRSVSESIVRLYDEAIERGLNEGFIQEAARACELAGNYLERQGSRTGAMEYWIRAHSLYLEWGACAKAAQLRRSKNVLELKI